MIFKIKSADQQLWMLSKQGQYIDVPKVNLVDSCCRGFASGDSGGFVGVGVFGRGFGVFCSRK